MTTSRTTYALTLAPDDTDLGIPGGRIVLDALSAIHVTGTLTIPRPTAEVFAALDPRQNPAPKVYLTVTRTAPTAQTRGFELYVVGRTRRLDGTVAIDVASAETLLVDYSALEEDLDPLDLSYSLRDVVSYVLDAAGITFAPLPTSPDADVWPIFATVNRVINTAADDLYGYALGTNAKDLSIGTSSPFIGSGYVRWTAVAAGPANVLIWIDNSFRYGDEISGSIEFRTGTPGRTMRLLIRWIDSEGGTIREDATDSIPASGTGWSYFELHATAPAGTVRASFIASGIATAADQTFALDFPTLNLGPLVTRFTSMTETTPDYNYAPAGEPNRSVTLRQLRNGGVNRPPESLIWAAGQSAFDFLAPLLEVSGMRLVCDETGAWSIREATHTAPGTLTITEGINLNDSTMTTDMSTWGDAAVVLYDWTDVYGNRRQDVETYGSPNPRRVITVNRNTKPAGNGLAQAIVERALTRGEAFSVRTAPDWTAKAQQTVTLAVGGLTGSGKADAIEFDLDTDRMTVTGTLDIS